MLFFRVVTSFLVLFFFLLLYAMGEQLWVPVTIGHDLWWRFRVFGEFFWLRGLRRLVLFLRINDIRRKNLN